MPGGARVLDLLCGAQAGGSLTPGQAVSFSS